MRRKRLSALMTAALMFCTLRVQPFSVMQANAAGSVTLSGDTLLLRGAVTKEQIKDYRDDENVRHIVAEEGTVLPQDCSELFLGNVKYGFQDSYSRSCWKTLESVDLSNADTSGVESMNRMFSDCGYVRELNLSGIDTSHVTDMRCMFYSCKSLSSLDLSSFDTAQVTDMHGLFMYCESLTGLDLTGFDTANVTDMSSMFYNCYRLGDTLDLSGFDTSKVTTMREMFYNCRGLHTIYAGSLWDNTHLESPNGTYNTFSACTELVGENGTEYNSISGTGGEFARLDREGQPGYFTYKEYPPAEQVQTPAAGSVTLSGDTLILSGAVEADQIKAYRLNPDVKHVAAAEGAVLPMICEELFLGLEIQDTQQDGKHYQDVVKCWENLVSVDLSKADASKVLTMKKMFSQCSNLKTVNLSGLHAPNLYDMSFLFSLCSLLTDINLSGFETSDETDMTKMFRYCISLTALDLSGFDTSGATNMSGMFGYCRNLTALNLTGCFDTSNVTDLSEMFEYCEILPALDVSSFDTSKATDLHSMFSGCEALTALDLSNFDTSKAENMSWMFCNCKSLTSLNVSSFNTANVREMYCMFRLCSALDSLDVSSFRTENTEVMTYLFSECSSLKELDLISFDTSKALSMSGMFEQCTALSKITVSDLWTTAALSDDENEYPLAGEYIFVGCTALKGGNGTAFDPAHIGREYACIDKEGQPGYLTAAPQKAQPGDVNGDGSVDLKDVTLMRRALAGWNVTVSETAADVNRDGSFDLKDVVILRRYLAGGWDVELK